MSRAARDQGLTPTTTRAERAHASRPAADEARRAYAPPRLAEVATADVLLEVLGPAQANYGAP